jgi:NADH-quinone oxidoreductase subunit L
MTWPLILLAIPSVLAGVWGIDHGLARFFNGPEHATGFLESFLAPFGHSPLAATTSLLAVVLGFSLAYTLYRRATTDPVAERLGILARAMRRKFYFDEIYDFAIRATHETLARLADFIDRALIEGFAVRGVTGTTDVFGRALRLLQTGNLQTYTFLFAAGVAIVLVMVLYR